MGARLGQALPLVGTGSLSLLPHFLRIQEESLVTIRVVCVPAGRLNDARIAERDATAATAKNALAKAGGLNEDYSLLMEAATACGMMSACVRD